MISKVGISISELIISTVILGVVSNNPDNFNLLILLNYYWVIWHPKMTKIQGVFTVY
jgi:hypothetical protein